MKLQLAQRASGVFEFHLTLGESNTLPLMIENEPVHVIINSGATCNLMSEQLFDN